MGIAVIPAAAGGKTMFRQTLLSGTTYTVPANVTYLNVTLVGGGGRGDQFNNGFSGAIGYLGGGGEVVSSTLNTSPGAIITYGIGAGSSTAGLGGTTTFTGATSANGGASIYNRAGTATISAFNSGNFSANGGAGCIYVEYWA